MLAMRHLQTIFSTGDQKYYTNGWLTKHIQNHPCLKILVIFVCAIQVFMTMFVFVVYQ